MNKEQLLAWAVKHVPSWGARGIGVFEYPQCELTISWRAPSGYGSDELVLSVPEEEWYVTRGEWEAAKVACGLPQTAPAPVTAHSILEAAGGHMRDRAATYDKPEGERSMGATVDAFRAITGHKLTEEQGWLFMQLLKAVRSQQGAYRDDSYADGAAYCALAGEAAARERGSNEAEG